MEMIGWDPISFWKQSPGFVQVYCAFLFVLMAVMVVRAVLIGKDIWRNRKQPTDVAAQQVWEPCRMRIQSIKRWANLTGLLDLAISFWLVSDALSWYANPMSQVDCDCAGGYSEMCIPVLMGLVASVLLLAEAMLLDSCRTKWLSRPAREQ